MTAKVCSLFHSSPSANNGEQTAGLLAANKHQSVVTTATRYIDSISRSTYGQRRELERGARTLSGLEFSCVHSSFSTHTLPFTAHLFSSFSCFFHSSLPFHMSFLSLFYFIGLQWPPFSCLSPKKNRSLLNRG
jgi:hypothetical protein